MDALLDALAILLPVHCAGCDDDDRTVCRECREYLEPDVRVREVGSLRVHTALEYSGVVRRIILAFKESNRTDAAAALARPLAHAVARALDEHAGAEIVLVPSSTRGVRARGYDPVRTLARAAGLRTRTVLAHTGATGVQKALGVADRESNRRDAFVSVGSIVGLDVVLVDDVLTSGATIRAAATAIEEAGGRVVAGATLAFTPRLLPFRDKADGSYYGGAKGA